MIFQQVNSSLTSEAEALADDGRVDILVDEILASLEQLACNHNSSGSAVVAVLLLSLCDFDDHLRSGVLDVHLLEDRRTIVGDDYIAHRIDEHLVHPLRAECRSNRIGDCLRSGDVVALGTLSSSAVSSFLQNENRCLSPIHCVPHPLALLRSEAADPKPPLKADSNSPRARIGGPPFRTRLHEGHQAHKDTDYRLLRR